jgi:hypothetical protein
VLLAANAFSQGESDEPQQADDASDPEAAKFAGGAWAALAAKRQHHGSDDPDAHAFDLWRECAPALDLFLAVETQFRYDEGLPTGLDYASVRSSPAFRAIARSERESIFADVCVIERAWVNERVRRAIERRRRAAPSR